MRNSTKYRLDDFIEELLQLIDEIESDAIHDGYEEGYEACLKEFDRKRKETKHETHQENLA